MTHSWPYHPQTLGKDERFHGTLTRELRPHEALGLAVPARRYQPSARSYPEVLPPLEYDAGTIVRKVQQAWLVHFRWQVYKISKAFTGYAVRLRPLATDGQYELLFGQHRLQTTDLQAGR